MPVCARVSRSRPHQMTKRPDTVDVGQEPVRLSG